MEDTYTLRLENESVIYLVCNGDDVLRMEVDPETMGGVKLSTTKPISFLELINYGLIIGKMSGRDIRKITDHLVELLEGSEISER